jgi:hypothetical protein
MINGGDSDRGGQACCPLEDSEAIEIIRIRNVAGLTDGRTPLVPMPPCRAPAPYHLGCGPLGRGAGHDAQRGVDGPPAS